MLHIEEIFEAICITFYISFFLIRSNFLQHIECCVRVRDDVTESLHKLGLGVQRLALYFQMVRANGFTPHGQLVRTVPRYYLLYHEYKIIYFSY